MILVRSLVSPLVLRALFGWASCSSAAVAALPVAAADDVFLQEMGRQIAAPTPLEAVAVFDGQVYAGTKDGLLLLQGDALGPVADVKQPVTRLVATKQALWALSPAGLFRLQAGQWRQISDQPTADVTEHLGEVVVASNRKLWKVEDDKLVALGGEECTFPIARENSHSETHYAQDPARLN
jgi:hypothetical protein